MILVIIALLIGAPIVFGLLAWVAPSPRLRSAMVIIGTMLTMVAGAWAAALGNFTYVLTEWHSWWVWFTLAVEALIALIIIYLGWRNQSMTISFLGAVHLCLIATGEYYRIQQPQLNTATKFLLDPLALMLVLIICFIGSFIVLYALGYMKHHEEHAPATAASTGRFFLFLLGFLGVMNGLVLSDTVQWLGIFWELTTLCSFMLIGHDGTVEARNNAKLALLIGAFGGMANLAASTICLGAYGVSQISGVMAAGAMVPMALFSVGALTKSAQIPFQSWLLGAMIAPTPVSALLHSATMVKAGSYLVLRMSPAFAGSRLMAVLALIGALSFAMASALAIGQSNSKKVLAYSTIANLGLIVTCAGLGTPLAFAAGLMILCFHAASKGLLFLCVGTIEQEIGSRDIEDMGGIRFRMPLTTAISLIGMASMLIPPFGMLMSKWMAIEAAINSPLILMLLVAGSALTVVFWVRWMGRIHTVSYHPEIKREKLAPSMLVTLVILVVIVVVSGAAAMPIHLAVFDPLAVKTFAGRLNPTEAARALAQLVSIREFSVWPILLLIVLAFVGMRGSQLRMKARHVRLPFLCGENVEEEGKFYTFRSLRDQPETAWGASVYLTSVFQEKPVTFWANVLAGMLVISLFAMTGIV